tara:strand:+ start:1229 stop:2413 length:1185 start_codon:yes stop_codon:yes gene_type:complete
MAKKKKEEVVEKTPNEPKGDVTKVKASMKKPGEVVEQTVTKVDLDKPPKPKEDEVEEGNADNSGVVASAENADAPQEQEEVQPETETQETTTLEEVVVGEAEEVADVASAAIEESMATGNPLPENVQKLMDFMEDTGGDLNDYVKLNRDYSKMDNHDLLHEYFKQTKPHLDGEEINFLMEDQFSFDEDIDDEREIKKKKIALKEQVANAKSHLDGQKSKYYDEIKSGTKLTEEQREAVNFYQKNQKYQSEEQQAKSRFLKQTDNVFNSNFKGFEFNVGEKNYRFNVKDIGKTKEAQSDINNFIGKFLNENNEVADAAGYHKSLFTAMNSDAIAKHFYEQGKSDAIKDSVANSKNINMNPRQELTDNIDTGGIKVRAMNDDNDFKFKIKNNKFKN